MSRQLSGPTDEVLRTLLDRYRLSVAESPVVMTLPESGVVESFLGVAREAPLPTPLSVVIPQRAVENLPQSRHPFLAAVDDREGCAIRSAPTSATVVSVPSETTVVDTDLPESLGLTSPGGAHDRYATLWESGVEARFDTPPHGRLLSETERRLGARSRSVVETELDRSRARGDWEVDVVCLALWAGAVSNTSVRAVIDLVETLDIMSRGTVERRLERLRDDEGLIDTLPLNDGSSGRPSRQLRIGDDIDVPDPVDPPDWVRTVLSA